MDNDVFILKGGAFMTNNFFKMLAKLNSEFLQKYTPLPVSSKETIKRLILYVGSGSWSKPEVTKLYCCNWNKSYDQLRLIFTEEGFRDRNEVTIRRQMFMYGKEARNRKQEIDRQYHTIPNQRPKDKHYQNVHNRLFRHG